MTPNKPNNKKYIFITGGVVSGLGKGIATSVIGTLLTAREMKVSLLKLDPYINVDPGTMNPFQHGEVFVTYDGAETDLDLGHYERFTGTRMTRENNYTSGRIYANIIARERKGEFLGETVQVIPHITDEIKRVIRKVGRDTDITLVEIGGTVGDIESLPFLEAIRQIRLELGSGNTLFIHITWIPYLHNAGEIKTKPTQHSVKEMRSIGLQPDILICRSERRVQEQALKKISLFTNVEQESVISMENLKDIYNLPFLLHERGVDQNIIRKLGLKDKKPNLEKWQKIRGVPKSHRVNIAMIGKYTELIDAYKSLNEAIDHAGIHTHIEPSVKYVDAELLETGQAEELLNSVDAILIPGAFGHRGSEGKLIAIEYARRTGTPYLGICFGMQMAVAEFARNQLNLKKANSTEIDPDTDAPVVSLVNEWEDNAGKVKRASRDMGGTMRLGEQECLIGDNSLLRKIYGKAKIYERHRHRYEINPKFVPLLEEKGMHVVGRSRDDLVEAIELKDHPWFIGCQFHPEFTSSPTDCHPLFKSFLLTARDLKKAQQNWKSVSS